MTVFRHYSVGKIHFGPGSIQKLHTVMAELKEELSLPTKFTALVVAGRHAKESLLPKIQLQLAKSQIEMETFILPPGEPELATVEAGIKQAEDAFFVIGAGGGSALDTAKAIAGLAKLPGKPEDYFYGRTIDKPSLPWLGIPTTAGSGSEVTNNSVLIHDGKKQSVRSPLWFAKAALVDPELTLTLPQEQTAICGLDALTHAIEGYLSRYSNPLSELMSLEAVKWVAKNLPLAVNEGYNLKAREGVLLGSMLSAMAFVNSRLGAVHGLAHPVGVRSGKPHGLICGLLLPHVLRYNLPVLGEKGRELAKIWNVEEQEEVAEELSSLLIKFNLPTTLSQIGIKREDLVEIVRDSLPSASTTANPKTVDAQSLQALVERAF